MPKVIIIKNNKIIEKLFIEPPTGYYHRAYGCYRPMPASEYDDRYVIRNENYINSM